ncbi:MAG TPA: murein L,D-transpeptidase [Chloroflexi bacterium]|nr:murein L,D-transpeptidase [Chloroflexota bacterium]
MPSDPVRITRRDFIKRAGVTLTWLALPAFPIPDWPCGKQVLDPPPTQFGRIATWWRQAVHTEARQESERIAWFTRDEIIPLYATVMGKAPWPNNPVWYQTEGGFIHSGYVQPVENSPSSEVITEVAAPGFWAQVCVPIAQARWKPDSAYVRYKLYYGTVYRVIGAVQDEAGEWWYQLQDGVTYAPGPYVPTWSVRRILPEEMTPISPGHPDKWIEIRLATQTLTCFEGETTVFRTGISSGAGGTTPRGEHRVLYKRHTRRMTGGGEDDYYDLPGISFPVYFTRNAVAIHGTYWHNDFVRPHSHGCINVTNQAAQWVFRWVEPLALYEEYEKKAKLEEGTRVVVV